MAVCHAERFGSIRSFGPYRVRSKTLHCFDELNKRVPNLALSFLIPNVVFLSQG
jgi:hypothetical protein